MQSDVPLQVFLADDSVLIRSRVAALLGAAHAVVVGQAATPQGAIEGILASHPDVVVLDVQLEGGTGLEVLRAVRRAAPAIAFVVFTSHSGRAYRKRYLGEGACAFLDKSAEFEDLARTVAAAASQHAH
ncbi:MAG: response regulator [Comamonadaceae bacterium]|nr:MAG: response regulator [Comamonadaceae bacterium]